LGEQDQRAWEKTLIFLGRASRRRNAKIAKKGRPQALRVQNNDPRKNQTGGKRRQKQKNRILSRSNHSDLPCSFTLNMKDQQPKAYWPKRYLWQFLGFEQEGENIQGQERPLLSKKHPESFTCLRKIRGKDKPPSGDCHLFKKKNGGKKEFWGGGKKKKKNRVASRKSQHGSSGKGFSQNLEATTIFLKKGRGGDWGKRIGE